MQSLYYSQIYITWSSMERLLNRGDRIIEVKITVNEGKRIWDFGD